MIRLNTRLADEAREGSGRKTCPEAVPTALKEILALERFKNPIEETSFADCRWQ